MATVRNLLILSILVFAGTQAHAQVYTKADVLAAVKDVPANGRVVEKAQIKDVTPPTDCERGDSTAGVGHQETKICMDSAPAIRDVEVKKSGKLVRWKGNKNVGYYRLREDGSLDFSKWRSSMMGVAA